MYAIPFLWFLLFLSKTNKQKKEEIKHEEKSNKINEYLNVLMADY